MSVKRAIKKMVRRNKSVAEVGSDAWLESVDSTFARTEYPHEYEQMQKQKRPILMRIL